MTNRKLVEVVGDVAGRALLGKLRGAQAAKVASYNATEGTVSIDFVLPQSVRDRTDEGEEGVAYVRQPGMDDVPVAFLGTPAAGVTLALPPGTEGAFIPWERDHSGYLVTGQSQAEVRSTERHTQGCGGFFIPFCVAFPTATETDGDGGTVLSGPLVYLAGTAGAQAMARADRAEAQLQALAERLYFVESYLAMMQVWFSAAQTVLSGLGVVVQPATWEIIGAVPVPLASVPPTPWANWNGPRPWASGIPPTPPAFAGMGPTGADRVKGI